MTPSKTGRREIAPLLPRPKRRSARAGAFQLSADTPILLPPSPTDLPRGLLLAAETARSAIAARSGLTLPIERPRTRATAGPAISLELEPRAAISPRLDTARDAYRLTVGTKSITLRAPTHHGLRYGLAALSQLVSASGSVPATEILDQPDYLDRGIMLDVSRGKVPRRETLEGLVDLCATLRLNVLMLYVEHTFAFRTHPEIGEGVSPLDAETILGLDEYAADRGVELVPCLQSLGHMEHILSIDRYAKLAESDRKWSLTPTRKETYQFLGELYDEFLPLFRSGRVNANCDEPFDLGRGQSAERAPQKTPGRLFADHVSQLEKLAARHDKKLMVWADFALKHPDQLGQIGRDVVLMDWWYETKFDFDRIKTLRRKGFTVWACPGTSSWNCLFPRIDTAMTNISAWADAGRRHGATGLLNTDWGDFGHYNALGLSFQGYAWGAQESWSGAIPEEDFDRAFAAHVFNGRDARLGKLYRRLGAIHDPGFTIANGSALQYLYFDALDRSFFLQHAKRSALAASGRKLAVAERLIETLGLAQDAIEDDTFAILAEQEIVWAARALRFSIDKSLASIDYNAWRNDPSSHTARSRNRLAKDLDVLADRQHVSLIELTRLWLARSEISEFHKTRKRIRKSISSLRRAAKRLREDRPPRPAKESAIGMLDVFNEVRRDFGMAPR